METIKTLKSELEAANLYRQRVEGFSKQFQDKIESLTIELEAAQETNKNNVANWELQCSDLRQQLASLQAVPKMDAQTALEVYKERDTLRQQLAVCNDALTIMEQNAKAAQATIKELRIQNLLWSATFQKYESWKANGAAGDVIDQVVTDYRKIVNAIKGGTK